MSCQRSWTRALLLILVHISSRRLLLRTPTLSWARNCRNCPTLLLQALVWIRARRLLLLLGLTTRISSNDSNFLSFSLLIASSSPARPSFSFARSVSERLSSTFSSPALYLLFCSSCSTFSSRQSAVAALGSALASPRVLYLPPRALASPRVRYSRFSSTFSSRHGPAAVAVETKRDSARDWACALGKSSSVLLLVTAAAILFATDSTSFLSLASQFDVTDEPLHFPATCTQLPPGKGK